MPPLNSGWCPTTILHTVSRGRSSSSRTHSICSAQRSGPSASTFVSSISNVAIGASVGNSSLYHRDGKSHRDSGRARVYASCTSSLPSS